MSLPGKRADMIVHQTEPINAESAPAPLAAGDLTALDTFYVRSHGPTPSVQSGSWRLGVGGLVGRELSLSLADLRSGFPQRTLIATLQCAGNRRQGFIAVREIPGEVPWGPGATGTARWRGVALADVLRAAGLHDGARHLEFLGCDTSPESDPPQPFGGSISRQKALAGEVLLAWEMNGEALPAMHGAPLRVVVPGYIGARSVKWLTQITAQAEPSDNFFQARAYRLLPAGVDPDAAPTGTGVQLGSVAVNADILDPADGASVIAGRLSVRGYGFAGDDRRIVRVDVSTDGGAVWQQAQLLDEPSRWSWRRWRADVELPAGPAEIVARAWDSAAGSQPRDAAQLWNPKGYVNNSWARVRLNVEP
jgi:sulfite oxidase